MRCTNVFVARDDARAPQPPNHVSRAPRHHSPAPSASIIGELVQRARCFLVPAMCPSSCSTTLSRSIWSSAGYSGPAFQFSLTLSARSLSTTLPRLTQSVCTPSTPGSTLEEKPATFKPSRTPASALVQRSAFRSQRADAVLTTLRKRVPDTASGNPAEDR